MQTGEATKAKEVDDDGEGIRCGRETGREGIKEEEVKGEGGRNERNKIAKCTGAIRWDKCQKLEVIGQMIYRKWIMSETWKCEMRKEHQKLIENRKEKDDT